MKQTHILEIESALEAQALRATAECLGAPVSVTWVANSQQVVDFLAQSPPHELILICGHGDERGFLLPLLADDVKARFPFNGFVSPSGFESFVRLNGNVVLSSCCGTGTQEMAGAFLENGARCFVAPVGFPEGDAALLFCLHFIFVFLKSGRDARTAFEAANHQVENGAKFLFFE